MSRIKTTDRSKLKGRSRAIEKKIIIGALIFIIFTAVIGCIQTCNFKIFGAVPNILLSFVLSIGFLFGEREGGAVGTALLGALARDVNIEKENDCPKAIEFRFVRNGR